jgi:hypothetical protein
MTYAPVFLKKGCYRHHIGSSSSNCSSGSWIKALKASHEVQGFDCFDDHKDCLGHARLGAHVRKSGLDELAKLFGWSSCCCMSHVGTYVIPVCKQPTRGVHTIKLKCTCPAIIDENAPVDICSSVSQFRVQVCNIS